MSRSRPLPPGALAPVCLLVLVLAACDSTTPSACGSACRTATVDIPLDTIELTHIGQTWALSAAVIRDEAPIASPVAWGVRDHEIAEVTQTGDIVARGVGTTHVFAFADSGGLDSVAVAVRQVITRVDVSPATAARPAARAAAFSAQAFDAGDVAVPDVEFSWSSSDDAVATVDPSGLAQAVAVGAASIRAAAGDVHGEAVFTVDSLPRLRVRPDTILVGAGLLRVPNPEVTADARPADQRISVFVTGADPAIVGVPPMVRVPYWLADDPLLEVRGRTAGETTIELSAPGWKPARAVIRVTTPRLVAIADTEPGTNHVALALGTTSVFSVTLRDSLGGWGWAVDPVVVTARSSNPAVVRVSPETVPAEANLTLTPVAAGDAQIICEAPGFTPDTVHVRVTAPRLVFTDVGIGRPRLTSVGVGQRSEWSQVNIGASWRPFDQSLDVALEQRHPEFLRLAAQDVTIEPFQPRAEVILHGLAPGTDTIIATAVGFEPDTIVVLVTSSKIHVVTSLTYEPTPLYATEARPFNLFLVDSFGVTHDPSDGPVTVQVTSSDPSVLRPGQETIQVTRGTNFVFDALKAGTASITFSDPSGIFRPDTIGPYTVTANGIVFGDNGRALPRYEVGFGQQILVRPGVVILDYGFGARPLRIYSTNPAVARPDREILDVGTGNTFPFTLLPGEELGRTWFVVEGDAFVPDSLEVVISQPHLQAITTRTEAPVNTDLYIDLYFRDASGNYHAPATDFNLLVESSDPSVLESRGLIDIDAGQLTRRVRVRTLGPGTAFVRISDPRIGPAQYTPAASLPITVVR